MVSSIRLPQNSSHPHFSKGTGLELSVEGAKCFFLAICCLPHYCGLNYFFNCIMKVLTEYHNVIIIYNVNIDISNARGYSTFKLAGFCNFFTLTSIISDHKFTEGKAFTYTDFIVANKPRSLFKPTALSVGLSACCKLILTTLACGRRPQIRTTNYRSY